MKKDTFIYSFEVTGLERKQVATIIAEALGEQVKYAGPPSFSYQVSSWTIDRNCLVTTPELATIELELLRKVLDALKNAGVLAKGDGTVTFSMEGHNEASLRNVVNLIWSKQNLLKKSLGRQDDILTADFVFAVNYVPIDTTEDFTGVINNARETGKIEGTGDLTFDIVNQTVSFGFLPDTLDCDEVIAFITLCQKINEQAKLQKFSSTKQKVTGNDKYSLRVWLIRLGFVGNEYKMDRKILLSRLTGDGAFRIVETKIVKEIEKLRADLVRIQEGKAYTDPEVIRASQELDRALDVYQELMLKKTDKE